jgi:hypothetical protein
MRFTLGLGKNRARPQHRKKQKGGGEEYYPIAFSQLQCHRCFSPGRHWRCALEIRFSVQGLLLLR